MLYKVLKAGIRQRTSEGWSTPKVGDVIKVSDAAAPVMIKNGWIQPYGGAQPAEPAPPTGDVPLSRRERRKKAWLGLGAEQPVTTEAEVAQVPPPKNEEEA